MVKINLMDFYPHCIEELIVEVEDEIAEWLCRCVRTEQSQMRKMRRYHVGHASEWRCDCRPESIAEQNIRDEHIYCAMKALTTVQLRRIYLHFFMGHSKVEIARREGVSESVVRKSIKSGLEKLGELLKNFI